MRIKFFCRIVPFLYIQLLLSNIGIIYAQSPLPIQTFLNPFPGTSRGFFGGSIAVSDIYVLIGAHRDRKAYLFDKTTGDLLQTFNHPSPSKSQGHFGLFTAINGSHILIGDPGLGVGLRINVGAAFLFDAVTGNLLHTFSNPSPGQVFQFGLAVSLTNSQAVISTDTRSQIIYVFNSATGALERTITSPNPGINELFGLSVAADGSAIIIGSPKTDTAGESAGAAYLFDASTGNLLQTFVNPVLDSDGQQTFGWSVAIMNSRILISDPSNDTGVVYLFDAVNGTLLQSFVNPELKAKTGV